MRCQKCGSSHENNRGTQTCAGHKSSGAPCRAFPIHGARVCRVHGGSAPAVRRKAAERVALRTQGRKIGELLAEHEVHDLHPLEGLLDAVRRTSSMMRILGDLLAERSASGIDSAEGSHDLARMYSDWARLNAQVSKMALDANIDERIVKSAESTVTILTAAVERAISRAGIPLQHAVAFRKALGQELRRVAGGPVEIEVATASGDPLSEAGREPPP